MLFASIVFMSRTLRVQWISVVLVFVLKLNIASNSQIPHDNAVKFDGGFDSFLKDLGSMVYKSKTMTVSGNALGSSRGTYPTLAAKDNRRSQIYNTQKAVLGDVLMMKLVSYYEDKYKLTHLASTTTERITIMSVFTKNNLNKYDIDKAEVFNNKPPSRVTYGLNRRMQRDMRKVDEYTIPEVVVL